MYPGIFVGRRLFRREADELSSRGVTAVLDLAPEVTEVPILTTLDYCHLPMLDLVTPGQGDLLRAVRFIDSRQGHGKVYIHCKLGLSRSVAVVAAYLIRRGYSPQHAQKIITSTRTGVVISRATQNVLNLLKPGNGSEEGTEFTADRIASTNHGDMPRGKYSKVIEREEALC